MSRFKVHALIFTLGFCLALVGLEAVSSQTVSNCFTIVGRDEGRIGIEYSRFLNRDRSKPSVIFLGGSETREAFDRAQTLPYFSDRGLQFFNLSMSVHDTAIEKYQVLSALKLEPHDHIFYVIGNDDFIPTEEPNPAGSVFETASAYLKRAEILGEKPTVSKTLVQALGSRLSFVRHRDLFRRCLLIPDAERPADDWHQYGDRPEEAKLFEAALEKYKTKKIDEGKLTTCDDPRIRLLRSIRDKWNKQITFVDMPRNPRLPELYSPGFLEHNAELTAEFHIFRLSQKTQLSADDFFDFNHLHSEGSKRFTKQILPVIYDLMKGEANGH